jgi:hypothetical protein
MALLAGYADEREAIEETFFDAWSTLGDPAKIEVDNFRFEMTQVKDQNWGRLTIIPGETEQVGLGTKPYSYIQGQIVLQLFAPEKTGTEEIRVLADQFLDIWKDANGRPLDFSKGNSGLIRTAHGWVTRDGVVDGWYQMRAIVPFTRSVRAA